MISVTICTRTETSNNGFRAYELEFTFQQTETALSRFRRLTPHLAIGDLSSSLVVHLENSLICSGDADRTDAVNRLLNTAAALIGMIHERHPVASEQRLVLSYSNNKLTTYRFVKKGV